MISPTAFAPRGIRLLLSVFLSSGALCQAGEISFVRHGETEANASGHYNSATVNQLTAKGQKQAQDLVGRLKGEKFDAIVISPARRCQLTLQPWAEATGARAAIWPELEEVSNRVLKATGGAAAPSRGGVITPNAKFAGWLFFSRAEDRKYLLANTRREALAQIDMAAVRLREMARKPGVKILVVGHSLIGSRLLERLLGKPMDGKMAIENGAVTRLTVDYGGRAVMTQQNNHALTRK